jgi:chromosome segregation ATPase
MLRLSQLAIGASPAQSHFSEASAPAGPTHPPVVAGSFGNRLARALPLVTKADTLLSASRPTDAGLLPALLHHASAEIATLSASLRDTQAERARLAGLLDAAQQALEAQQKQGQELHDRLSEADTALASSRNHIGSLAESQSRLTESVVQLSRERDALSSETRQLGLSVEAARQAAHAATSRAETSEAARQEADTASVELSRRLRLAEDELVSMRASLSTHVAQSAEHDALRRAQGDDLSSQLAAALDRCAVLGEQLSHTRDQLSTAREQLLVSGRTADGLHLRLNQLIVERDELLEALRTAKAPPRISVSLRDL